MAKRMLKSMMKCFKMIKRLILVLWSVEPQYWDH